MAAIILCQLTESFKRALKLNLGFLEAVSRLFHPDHQNIPFVVARRLESPEIEALKTGLQGPPHGFQERLKRQGKARFAHEGRGIIEESISLL
jgi:hypothetical protein